MDDEPAIRTSIEILLLSGKRQEGFPCTSEEDRLVVAS